MSGIPPAVDSDVEDVVWALETASSLWKRNERVDAIVWLRRAAQAAGAAEHDDRAFALAREAAELSEWIVGNPIMAANEPSMSASSVPPHESMTGGVDDLLRQSMSDIPIEIAPQVSMSAMTEPHAFAPVKVPVVAPPPPSTPIPNGDPSQPDVQPESPPAEVFQSVSERTSENVKSAAEAHAGLLDPWGATSEEPSIPPLPISGTTQTVSSEDYDEEVVTSARLEIPPAEPAMVMHVAPVAPPPMPHAPPPIPHAPPPLPNAPPVSMDEAALESVPSSELSAPPEKQTFPTESTLVSAGVLPPKKTDGLDLAAVEALADLPDEVREELERVAEIHRLSLDEEIMGFALAHVIEGDVDVAAQIVDVPAERIAKGTVLKAYGTIAESMPLRLICASEKAVVATWTAEQIEPAFKACPWVEDDLRVSANRIQALVGVTLGPLAERLDATLRAQVTSKLTLRELAEGEIVCEVGHAVRDLCLVGQGVLELVKDGEVVGEVPVGDFLFPAEIMAGGKATLTARAGKGGALLLASDRAVAQELMVTCPPLLEIFSGM